MMGDKSVPWRAHGWLDVCDEDKAAATGPGLGVREDPPLSLFGQLIPMAGSTGMSDCTLKVSSAGIFIIFPF